MTAAIEKIQVKMVNILKMDQERNQILLEKNKEIDILKTALSEVKIKPIYHQMAPDIEFSCIQSANEVF